MWPEAIHRELAAAKIRLVGYVPDAGHKRLIELCQADHSMRAVVLSTVHRALDAADRGEIHQPELDDLARVEREDAVQVGAALGSEA